MKLTISIFLLTHIYTCYFEKDSLGLNFIPFENGCDVTTHFMLGRTKSCTLLSVHGKIHARLQKGVAKMLARMQRRVMMSHPFS